MTRAEFEHAVRAAGAILGTDEVLVIGSQALHGSVAKPLPIEAGRSVEVDVGALPHPTAEMADLIDGSIGEASMFHGRGRRPAGSRRRRPGPRPAGRGADPPAPRSLGAAPQALNAVTRFPCPGLQGRSVPPRGNLTAHASYYDSLIDRGGVV